MKVVGVDLLPLACLVGRGEGRHQLDGRLRGRCLLVRQRSPPPAAVLRCGRHPPVDGQQCLVHASSTARSAAARRRSRSWSVHGAGGASDRTYPRHKGTSREFRRARAARACTARMQNRDCRRRGDGLHHAVQAIARMHNLALAGWPDRPSPRFGVRDHGPSATPLCRRCVQPAIRSGSSTTGSSASPRNAGKGTVSQGTSCGGTASVISGYQRNSVVSAMCVSRRASGDPMQ